MLKKNIFSLLLVLPATVFAATPMERIAEARTAREAKNFPLAEEILTALIREFPASSEAYLARGYVWLGQKKTDMAAADFKKAVEVDPTNPVAYICRGDLAYRMIAGDFVACEADYAIVLKLDPHFPHFHAYSAELYLYLKQPSKVITEAILGLLDEPTEPIHKINLAHGLAFTGQIDAAKVLYTSVARTRIERGLSGASLALGDFAQLKRKGIEYPQMAELTPFLESFASPP